MLSKKSVWCSGGKYSISAAVHDIWMGIIYMSSNGLFLVDFAQRELLSWPFAMYLYQLYQSSAHLYDKFMIHTTFYHNGLSCPVGCRQQRGVGGWVTINRTSTGNFTDTAAGRNHFVSHIVRILLQHHPERTTDFPLRHIGLINNGKYTGCTWKKDFLPPPDKFIKLKWVSQHAEAQTACSDLWLMYTEKSIHNQIYYSLFFKPLKEMYQWFKLRPCNGLLDSKMAPSNSSESFCYVPPALSAGSSPLLSFRGLQSVVVSLPGSLHMFISVSSH